MVRLAIVGTGWQGQGLLSNLAQIPAAQVVGACDLNSQLLSKVMNKFAVDGYENYEEMLDKTRPDGVLICTHPQVRLPLVRGAAERGIHCFIEKPPAWDLKSAQQISDVLTESGVMSSVGFMFRYSQAVTKTRAYLSEHRVALVRSCMLDGLAIRSGTPSWFFDKSRSGGPVFDQGIHIFDLSRYLLGEVKAIAGFHGNLAVPKTETFTVEDSASLTFQYQNHVLQNHSHSWAYNGFKAQIQFVSDELDLLLDIGKGTVQGKIADEEVNFSGQDALYRFELEAFVRAIEERRPDLIRSTYQDSLSSLQLALCAVEALEQQSVVKL